MRATRLLKQEYQGFLVTVLEEQRTDIRIEHIPVVSKYPNVFPEDLQGLLPDREWNSL